MKKKIFLSFLLIIYGFNLLPLKIIATDKDYSLIDNNRSFCSDTQYELAYVKASNNPDSEDKFNKVGIAKNISCHNDYKGAKEAMDKIAFDPTNTVSIIKRREKKICTNTSNCSINYRYDVVTEIIDTKYGLLDVTPKPTTGHNTNLYKGDINNADFKTAYTYINGISGGDAAFIKYDDSKQAAYLMISGFKGWIKKVDPNDGYDSYTIVPYSLVKSPSYYTATTYSNYKELNHFISMRPSRETANYFGDLTIGVVDNKLNVGTNYYSYDGNYFYTSLVTMLDDYKNNSYKNSVNYLEPYYNYFQFLPYRAPSKLDSDALDNYIKSRNYILPKSFTPNTNESQMYGQGNNFVSSSEYYGTNAGLTFGIAINESGFGTSKIAMSKYNLFGHNANDYNPGGDANEYNGINASINYHNFKFISFGYSDIYDWRYFGSHVGNKNSGINVKYASDPYWGEKAAKYYYSVSKESGFNEYNNHLIGIKKENEVSIKKEPTNNSGTINKLENSIFGNITNVPVFIVGEVIGQNINGNNIWYKIVVDSKLDSNKNPIKIDAQSDWDLPIVTEKFDINNNIGYVHSSLIWTKDNTAPIINANDKVVYLNDSFNPLKDITAFDKEDGDVTSNIKITENTVNTNKVGNYKVIYSVTDKDHKTTTKTISIVVKTNNKPVLTVENKTLLQYKPVDLKSLAIASDLEDGNITNNIVIKGQVNFDVPGNYNLIYSITDSDNNLVSKQITITIKPSSDPVIKGEDKTINVGDTLNLLSLVTAYDNEDKDITSKIKITANNLNTNIPGKYKVTYSVTDSDNNTTTKTLVIIVNGNYIKKDAILHYEKLEFNTKTNKLDLLGFLVIDGINNKKNDNINFELILENQQDKTTTIIELDRLISNYPFEISLNNNFDYTGAWFYKSIDLSLIDEGDYNIYVRSRNNGYETTSLLKNVFNKPMTRKINYDNKGYLLRTNYYNKQTPIELFVRNNNLIGSSNPPTIDNMFNPYYQINFDNNFMNIKGTSFNVGIDYNINKNVERDIIFENIDTKQQYSYNIGSITNGDYQVTLRVNDYKDKTRAWYNAKLDISLLPKGKYSIIIKTKVDDFTDYGELTDVFGNSKNQNISINGKNISIFRNTTNRYRIELHIK